MYITISCFILHGAVVQEKATMKADKEFVNGDAGTEHQLQATLTSDTEHFHSVFGSFLYPHHLLKESTICTRG